MRGAGTLDDVEMIDAFPKTLANEYRGWWRVRTMSETAVNKWGSWQNLKADIEDKFGVNINATMKAFIEAKEGPWGFAARLIEIGELLSNAVSEKDIIRQFVNGLRNRVIAAFLKSKRIDSIEKAMDEAMQMREALTYEKEEKKRDREESKGGTGYNRSRTPEDRNPKKGRQDAPICKFCGKRGHVDSDCWSKQQSRNINSSRDKRWSQEERRVSNFDKNSETQKRVMTTKELGEHPKRLFVMNWYLNDGRTIAGIVDTAAAASLISGEAARLLGKDVEKKLDRLTTFEVASGHTVTTDKQVIVSARAIEGGSIYILELFVVENLACDIITGLDILEGYGAVVDCGKLELTMGRMREKIPMIRMGVDTHMVAIVTSADDGVDEYAIPVVKALSPWTEEIVVEVDRDKEKSLKEILRDFETIGSDSLDSIGLSRVLKHDIELKSGAEPVAQVPQRLSPGQTQEVRKQMDDLLKTGKIKPSKSPWAARLVLVKKNDGSTRICVDYREVNTRSKSQAYPMQRIDDLIERMGGKGYFTSIDLKAGYWQVELEDRAREVTAFVTPWGHYEFLVMPFGLRNASASFQKMMNEVLEQEVAEGFVVVYIDDILIFTPSWNGHLVHIRKVLSRIKEANLTIATKKCEWAKRKINFLGHELNEYGILPNAEKVKAVVEMEAPKTKREIQRFLGMIGYYRRFIRGFSKVAFPIRKLIKADEPWVWVGVRIRR